MIYLTHTRLMTESEDTVHTYAYRGKGQSRRVCTQLISNQPHYTLWLSQHDRRMLTVAARKRRGSQILTLREVAISQIHRTALVKYLRSFRIVGEARDQTLAEFHSMLDPQQSAVAEHRSYLVAASSGLCAMELLAMIEDRRGLDLLYRYETAYGHFFSMFCDRSRAKQTGAPYLLSSLIPEIKRDADRLRARIVSGEFMPAKRFIERRP